MYKYHLIQYFRNLIRNKSFSTINFLGLIIGMTVSLFIYKYVLYEKSYDKFNANGEDIYRVRYDRYLNGNLQFKCVGAIPALGPALKADFSEVQDFCRMMPFYDGLTVSKEKKVYRLQHVFFADASLFDMFSFKSIQGDVSNTFKDVNTAVISESTAKKFFGDEDPLGKTIQYSDRNNNGNLTITAVVEDTPENSHFKFDMLISYSTLNAYTDNNSETSWGWYDFYTYIQLKKGTDYKQLEAKFPEFIQKYTPNSERDYVLQPLYDIHLSSHYLQEMEANGNKSLVTSLSIIAIFVLLIAWANYINLSTVVAIDRFKEIGIRKTNGAGKRQILIPFFIETLFLNISCFGISILLYKMLMPLFIQFSEKSLTLVSFNTTIWLFFAGIIILGAIISGAIPAFFMATANPVMAIKKQLVHAHKRINPRKILVGMQYAIAIVLIVCTTVIFKQINFVRDYNLGVDIDRTLVVRGPGSINNYDEYSENLSFFKQELEKYPEIKAVSVGSNVPGCEIIWTNGIRKTTDEKTAIIYIVGIDQDYLDLFGLKLLAGRNYDKKLSTENEKVLLNKSAVRLLAFDNAQEAVNQIVVLAGRRYTVAGVIDDYHQRGLKEEPQPIVFRYEPHSSAFFSIKTAGNDLSETISNVNSQFNKLFPGNSFDYFFLDSYFNNQYKTDIQFGKVLTLFTLLALFICCLGLFGLALFSIKDRIKEIGIRKVNGAKKNEILTTFNYEYFTTIIAAFILAAPLAYYFSHKYLQGFAYKTDLSWWIFAISVLIALLVALVTVSWQSWQAATRNPVEALRYE